MAFYKTCWEVVKDNLMETIEYFVVSDFLDYGSNATFISLVPKNGGVSQIRDFRPISLMESVYKILSKVLADKLKSVLHQVISGFQGVFISGRQVLDGVLMIANEVIDSILKNGSSGDPCKLDLEKAYDRVNWDFLDYMMRKMGFGLKWRN